MASGAYQLVLRNLPAARTGARLSPVRRALAVPVQQLLRRRGRAAGPRSARHAVATDARRSARLSRPCRRGAGSRAARPRRGCTRPDRARHQSRAAASGTVPHRHPRDLRRQSAGAGLRHGRSRARRADRAARRCAGSKAAAGSSRSARATRGFAFDCERPRHQVLLQPHAIADRFVTNGEWQQFIADGGYRTPGHG